MDYMTLSAFLQLIELWRIHLVSLLCLLQLPSPLASGVPSRPLVSTASVHSFWKERRDVREEPCFVWKTHDFSWIWHIELFVGGKENTAVVFPSLLRQRNNLGNSHSSSGAISTELDSNINILIVCTASTLSVTAAFAVSLRESLSLVDTATVQVGLDSTQYSLPPCGLEQEGLTDSKWVLW